MKCGGCLASSIFALLSLPLARAAPTDVPSAASFFVPSLPDIHQDPNHPLTIYAGYLSSDPKASQYASTQITAHIYFVLVKNRRTADRERVLFWFNGGPGCSSFDGLMMEVGPWRMDGKGGFNVTEGGWEEYTTMVYVDQPAGTGFSYTSTDHYVHTLDEAAEQFLEFLRNFYQVFPEYQRMDTYLGGESFAGQYIPYFADHMLKSLLNIPLKGVAIGNGWIDARRQYPSFLEYAVKIDMLDEKSEEWKAAKAETDKCMALLNALPSHTEPISTPECERLLLKVAKVRDKVVNGQEMCMNIYDVRYDDTKPACGMNWPPDIKPITTYLGRKDVVEALHAQGRSDTWIECRSNMHHELKPSNSNSSITLLPRVLEKIPVLLFAGDRDYICNHVGQEAMIKAMTWNGATGLGTVETQSWTVAGKAAGTWVTSRNLTYAKIFNASHMAPYDVPHVTHDMILRFMGMNFSAIMDGSARIPSSIGANVKPQFIEQSKETPTPAPPPGKTPQQDKAMWEAYYNAGSAALVLVLVLLAIFGFLWCRIRRRRNSRVALNGNEAEESIPLNLSHKGLDSDAEIHQRNGTRKGKERALEEDGRPIFDVGDAGSDVDDSSELEGERYRDARNAH